MERLFYLLSLLCGYFNSQPPVNYIDLPGDTLVTSIGYDVDSLTVIRGNGTVVLYDNANKDFITIDNGYKVEVSDFTLINVQNNGRSVVRANGCQSLKIDNVHVSNGGLLNLSGGNFISHDITVINSSADSAGIDVR